MEFIEKLLNLVKDAPEMAIWVLVVWVLFTLSKLAGWIYLIRILVSQFVERYFNYKDNLILTSKSSKLMKNISKECLNSPEELFALLDILKEDGNNYVFGSDIRKAIKILKENR